MVKTIKFKGIGFVLGNYWGEESGAYPTIYFEADTREALLAEAKVALDNGSIVSGMGFESLIGAVLSIKQETSIEIDDDEYVNEKLYLEFIGEMTNEQIEFLENCCLEVC